MKNNTIIQDNFNSLKTFLYEIKDNIKKIKNNIETDYIYYVYKKLPEDLKNIQKMNKIQITKIYAKKYINKHNEYCEVLVISRYTDTIEIIKDKSILWAPPIGLNVVDIKTKYKNILSEKQISETIYPSIKKIYDAFPYENILHI